MSLENFGFATSNKVSKSLTNLLRSEDSANIQFSSKISTSPITNACMNTPTACYVYLLISTSGTTYVGATVELDRRLRQHNKEIKGGAHATSMKVNKGETWHRHCYVSGFPDWQAALQFEWRWKHLSRKLPLKMNPLERRMSALDTLLALERPTTKARAYSEWPSPPVIHYM